jgi:hypothetical protein
MSATRALPGALCSRARTMHWWVWLWLLPPVCSVSPWQEDQVRAQEFPHNCLCSVDYDSVEGPPSPRATHQPTTKFLGARAARGS